MSDDPLLDRLEHEERAAAVTNLVLLGARTAADLLSGRLPPGREIARALIDTALAFVPEDELRGHLTAGAVARAERIADAASRFARGESR